MNLHSPDVRERAGGSAAGRVWLWPRSRPEAREFTDRLAHDCREERAIWWELTVLRMLRKLGH